MNSLWPALMAQSPPPDPALGNVLRATREARGMTQEEASHAAGLTVGAYSRIERSEVAPAWSTVRAIADGLGLTMRELGAAVEKKR